MAHFIYPQHDLDKRANLLALLGTHWNNVYRGNGVTESFLFARGQEEAQSYLDLVETVASISRQSVPIYHRDNWFLLELKESELNDQPLTYQSGDRTYGDSAVYGQQSSSPWFVWTTPGLANATLICNRILLPSTTFVKGVDFTLAGGKITFNTNPFDDPQIPKREIYKGADVVDRTVGLWVYRGQFDWKHIHTHFGFILDVVEESSKEYRDFVNAILDAFAQGTAAKHVDLAISALTGVPVVREAEEVVEQVFEDLEGVVVVTDINVYRFHETATAVVSVGDTVYAGDRLTNGFEVIEFRDGSVPADLKALHMGEGFIGTDLPGGIGFTNKTVPLQVTSDANGITRVEFEVGGFPGTVEAFWDEVHARGLLSTTLARLMDVRGPGAPTEPTAASLPATVNPIEFLAENLLRFHAFVIRIRVQEAMGGVGLDHARLLRRIVPPWTAMIILFELAINDETVDPTLAGSATQPGTNESLTTFIGGDPVYSDEQVDPSVFTSESVKMYLVKGTCE